MAGSHVVQAISAGNLTNKYDDTENNTASSYDSTFEKTIQVDDNSYLKFKRLTNSEVYCPFNDARKALLARECCLFSSGHLTLTLEVDKMKKIKNFEVAFQEKTFGDAPGKKPLDETKYTFDKTHYDIRNITNLSFYPQRLNVDAYKINYSLMANIVHGIDHDGMFTDKDWTTIDEITYWENRDITKTLSNQTLADIFWNENRYGLEVRALDPPAVKLNKTLPLFHNSGAQIYHIYQKWIHPLSNTLASHGTMKYNLESAELWIRHFMVDGEDYNMEIGGVVLPPYGSLFFTSQYNSNMPVKIYDNGNYRDAGRTKPCSDKLFGVDFENFENLNMSTIPDDSFTFDAPVSHWQGKDLDFYKITLPYFSTSNYSSDNSATTGILNFNVSESNYAFPEEIGFLDNLIPTKFGPIIGSAGLEYCTYIPPIEPFFNASQYKIDLKETHRKKIIDFFHQILLSGQKMEEITKKKQVYRSIQTVKELLDYSIFTKNPECHFLIENVPFNTDGWAYKDYSGLFAYPHNGGYKAPDNPFSREIPLYKLFVKSVPKIDFRVNMKMKDQVPIIEAYYNHRPVNFKSILTPFTLSFKFNRMASDYLYKCREINIFCDAIENTPLYGREVPLLAQCVVKQDGCNYVLKQNSLLTKPASQVDDYSPITTPPFYTKTIQTTQTFHSIPIPPPSVILSIEDDEVVEKKLKTGNYSKFHFDLFYPNGEPVFFQKNSATTLNLDMITYDK